MRRYLLALPFIFAAPAAWAVDWQYMKIDNYMNITQGDDRFYLGCYTDGISMEYANAKETRCDKQKCYTSADYDAHGTQPISLTLDEGGLSLYVSSMDGPTVTLGYVDMSGYKGVDDQQELGAFQRTKTLKLEFPAISRTVTFDKINNGNALIVFFQNCIQKAIAFQDKQTELRKAPPQQPQQ